MKMSRGITKTVVRWQVPALSAVDLQRVGQVGLTLGSGLPNGVKKLEWWTWGCATSGPKELSKVNAKCGVKRWLSGLWLSRERTHCVAWMELVVVRVDSGILGLPSSSEKDDENGYAVWSRGSCPAEVLGCYSPVPPAADLRSYCC